MSGLPTKCCSSCYYSYCNYIKDTQENFDYLINQAQNQHEKYEHYFKGYIQRLNKTKEYVEKNQKVIDRIINEYQQSFIFRNIHNFSNSSENETNENSNEILNEKENKNHKEIQEIDMIDTECCQQPYNHQYHMVDTILQQIVREWTSEGDTLRKTIFEYFYNTVGTNKQVLVPGCGLGRLAFDLQQKGNECYACECSHFMLMAINALSQMKQNEMEMYPYLVESSDLINSNENFKSVQFPNVDPSLLNAIDFSENMFEEYCEECVIEFDCVCTLYFIYTAYNIVDYIKGIKKVLKEGGLWINLGPLHWVHEKFDSFHFGMNEILDICQELGFVIEQKEFIDDTLYIPNNNSTCPLTYKNIFFVLRNGKK